LISQVDVRPASSRAVQRILVVPMGSTLPEGGAHATDADEHRSVERVENVTSAPESVVNSLVRAVGHVSSGRSVSTTDTVTPSLPAAPCESPTVRTTSWRPTEKDAVATSPDATGTPSSVHSKETMSSFVPVEESGSDDADPSRVDVAMRLPVHSRTWSL